MVLLKKFDHLHLVYHFTVPLRITLIIFGWLWSKMSMGLGQVENSETSELS